MDWVPDLLGKAGTPRGERKNGGHQSEKTSRTETRELVDQIESKIAGSEIAVESESQSRETQNEGYQSQGQSRKTQIVALEKLETGQQLENESAELERLEQRLQRRV